MSEERTVWKRIPIPLDLFEEVDKVYREEGYTSRAEFIRDAVRRRIREIKEQGPRETVR